MKTISIALAALAFAGAAPTFAKEAAEEPAERAAAAGPTKDRKEYCIRGTATGSRVPMSVCRSRAAWAAEGVDVDRPVRD